MSGVSGSTLNHAAITARIPHAGAMSLLHEVVAWDAGSIECRARSHRDLANPLRSRNQLATVHGIEYAAQAMALHGALLGGEGAPATRPGYIGAVRALKVHAPRLMTSPTISPSTPSASPAMRATCFMRSASGPVSACWPRGASASRWARPPDSKY